jgi:hypothetical protein
MCPIYEATNNTDSISNYKYKGYNLDQQRYPTFSYEYKKVKIEDKIIPFENGKGLNRTINVEGDGKNDLMLRIAQGKSIKSIGNGLYSIDDQSYFIQISSAETPLIETHNGQQVLLASAQKKLSYQIIW